ncbi:23S rRNA (guanosine(2251)-2'-O)-methyltransferase RlmB [Zhongshania sp.]|uniref:23S rRNA (guanosine(2251)-2'-O)-methyltransferase RlmB n=1 Tax=Zhongshania sp. TaxID=1971902 RepID=UPI001B5ECA7F|nr:23S rRNA (guanosine(2251)-2'-O)-methyltransferase RlmB [Zhongshania sp.]MBQ0796748.1 23S rRNA (guanosine(2251)-2'-O)-methyltransferase RlmB [Zhongshania sp.]
MTEKIFGIHAVQAVLSRSPERVKNLYVQNGRADKRLQEVLSLASSSSIGVVQRPRDELDKMVEGRHQGVIAQVEPAPEFRERDLPDLVAAAGSAALILVLDGITDPHNLGACLRSADAAGVTAVVAPRDNSVGLSATVFKVACGAADVVPFIQVTNLARSLQQMQQAGIWIVGMAGEADTSLYDRDLSGPTALVLGAEGAGMRRLTRENCDYLAKLPMAGTVSSLNVSVAAGICLFEVVRQRQK